MTVRRLTSLRQLSTVRKCSTDFGIHHWRGICSSHILCPYQVDARPAERHPKPVAPILLSNSACHDHSHALSATDQPMQETRVYHQFLPHGRYAALSQSVGKIADPINSAHRPCIIDVNNLPIILTIVFKHVQNVRAGGCGLIAAGDPKKR